MCFWNEYLRVNCFTYIFSFFSVPNISLISITNTIVTVKAIIISRVAINTEQKMTIFLNNSPFTIALCSSLNSSIIKVTYKKQPVVLNSTPNVSNDSLFCYPCEIEPSTPSTHNSARPRRVSHQQLESHPSGLATFIEKYNELMKTTLKGKKPYTHLEKLKEKLFPEDPRYLNHNVLERSLQIHNQKPFPKLVVL